MNRRGRCWPLALAGIALALQQVSASEPPPPDSDTLETILVTVTPVMGTDLPLLHVPSNVQTLRAPQFDNDHTQTLTDAMDRHLSSVSLADTEGNHFQEDLVSRGFIASPVLGTPQGIALYQNGVRVNEAFGDIVLWDFIPVFAIQELQELPGSNPVFGLNALGGAITLQMKDGFDYQNSALELAGGSFGRYRATLQDGASFGDSAFYIGANASHEDGWRQLSSSDVVQTFADAALRGDEYKLGASLTLVWSHLNGNGAAPAQDDPAAAFAVPDLELDHLVFFQARGTKYFTQAVSLQGTAYARYMDSEIQNGAASGFTSCGETVCDDGEPVAYQDGAPIPSDVPYAGILPISTTRTLGVGGSLQLSLDQPVAGLSNVLNLGLTCDQGLTRFSSITQLGNLAYLNPPGTTTYSDGQQVGGAAYNVRLDTLNRYDGVFFTDTLSLTQAVNATVAARFNRAQVRLTDLYGDSLNGDHAYARLNPSAGLTYQVSTALNVYAGYSEANRIPSATELSCANPNQPCTFPLGFVSDPNLQQVIARTVELGARGRGTGRDLTLDWSADVYGTRSSNDIIFVSAGPLIGSGYFQNSGETQRLGAEAALQGTWRRLDFHANYGLVRATFQSHLAVFSEDSPSADANGDIYVQPGDRIPEVPVHSGKLGFGYQFPCSVHIGLDAIVVSNQYLRGDEANLQQPLSGYALLNARAAWKATRHVSFFFEGENILDRRYASFGLYSDPTGNGAFPNFTNPRFYTPGQPFGFWIGAQVHL
jgi:outer membrane receptor protein involved in Fe transport